MSGSVDCIWAMSNENVLISKAHQIAKDLRNPVNSSKELIEFFKTVPAKDIVLYAKFPLTYNSFTFEFSPILESKYNSYKLSDCPIPLFCSKGTLIIKFSTQPICTAIFIL